MIDAVISKPWQPHNEDDVAKFSSLISGVSQEQRLRYLRGRLLRDLQFMGMPERHERIAIAHCNTFKWIFRTPTESSTKWTNFVDWLQNNDGLYWITGKAGSGKSTLMKYIYGSTNTKKNLEAHNRKLPVITAGFFFWNSGTRIQMSQKGLLQTLLYESLRKCEDLIPLVFPQRWNAYEMFGQDFHTWSDAELLQGFKLLIKQDGVSAKFCFFVDGLDEFAGEPTVLINLFKDVVSTSQVKICLSSRPWLVFEDAFKHHSNLMLQDLTYPDITNYIGNELGRNDHFLVLKARKPAYAAKLVKDIATKAAGVFLWVKLVVTSLLAGLINSDRISDLQRRLELIPPGLEDLYGKMLDSLDPFYLEHASQLFQLVRAAYRPLSLLGMSFADEEDVMYAIEAEVKPLTDEEKLLRCEETRRRLNSRCKGLLEIPMTDVWQAPHRSQDAYSSTQPRQRYNKNNLNSSTKERTVNDSSSYYQQLSSHNNIEKSSLIENFEDFEIGDGHKKKMPKSENPDEYDSSNQTEEDGAHSSFPSSEEDDVLSVSADFGGRLLCLDVEKLGNLKIEYLHRTVKDYLEREEVWSQLVQVTTRSFNAQLSLCRANLSLLKVQDPDKISEDAFWECIIDCLNYATEAEANVMEPQVSVIDELGRVADIFDARGLELAEKAGIVSVSVDETESTAMSISMRVKQEKIALGAPSWHEQFLRSRSTRPDRMLSLPSRNPGQDMTTNPESQTQDRTTRMRSTPEERRERPLSPSLPSSPSRSSIPDVPKVRSQHKHIQPRWMSTRKTTTSFIIHWAGTHPEVDLSCTFHCFVTLFGLPLYLKRKLDHGGVALQDRNRRPFLGYLILMDEKPFVHYHSNTTSRLPHLTLVKAALEYGADPNQEYGGTTPWQSLLKRACEASKAFQVGSLERPQDRAFSMGRWADLVELFIQHGANPVEVQNSPRANAIREIFEDWDVLRTKKLDKLVRGAQRRGPPLGRLWQR